eukprot:6197102-Pleurochrysis_carterae.AAC.1
MPVRSSAVSAFRVVRIPCPGGRLALLVASVPCWVGAFPAIARRRGRLLAIRPVGLFRNERSALRPVELDIAADLTRLTVAQHFSDRGERER